MKILEVIGGDESGSSSKVTVRFANKAPQEKARFLVEAAFLLVEAGKEKDWGRGYTYRLDKRPANQGGDQIHIYRRHDAWAYRSTGARSEPRKYTTPATKDVKSIVRDVFSLGPDTKIESKVISAASDEILIEVTFS